MENRSLIPSPRYEEKCEIENLIFVIRGKQVMLDSDLARLYSVKTKRLNESVKRNLERFPDDFCFKLTKEDIENLRSQIATSKPLIPENRRYLPYVFTEQGIAMLSAVLKSPAAVEISISIMNAFVNMRKYFSSVSFLSEKLGSLEAKQIQYQRESERKFDEIFSFISAKAESQQKIFYEGEIFDAFSFLVSLVEQAEKSIVLIDNYVDVSGTLNILSKKKSGVQAIVFTSKNTKISKEDVKEFESQYPHLRVHCCSGFHDRFLILDDEKVFHVGASLKDAGRKCFAVMRITDPKTVKGLLDYIKNEINHEVD